MGILSMMKMGEQAQDFQIKDKWITQIIKIYSKEKKHKKHK